MKSGDENVRLVIGGVRCEYRTLASASCAAAIRALLRHPAAPFRVALDAETRSVLAIARRAFVFIPSPQSGCIRCCGGAPPSDWLA